MDVAPGSAGRLRVDVVNASSTAHALRLDIAGRAAAWLRVAPDDALASGAVVVEPGGTVPVELLVAPPATSLAGGQLVPFRLRAVSLRDPEVSGSATGLVVLSPPAPVSAALEPAVATGRRTAQLSLRLTTTQPDGVLVRLRANSPASGVAVRVEPVTLRVTPGQPATATVTAGSRLPTLLGTARHPVAVAWETEGRDGLVRGDVRASFEQRPPLPPAVTGVLLLVLVLGLGAGARSLAGAGLPWSASTSAAAPTGGAASPPAPSPSGTEAAPAGAVRAPYVSLASMPQGTDPARARQVAEALVERLNAQGLQVRLVDSSELPDAVPGPAYLAVVRDGFADLAAARRFCEQHRGAVRFCIPFA